MAPETFRKLREGLDRRALGLPPHPRPVIALGGRRRPWRDPWHGLTQAELAKRLGVHVLTLAQWEQGKRQTIPEPAARLLQHLAAQRRAKKGDQ